MSEFLSKNPDDTLGWMKEHFERQLRFFEDHILEKAKMSWQFFTLHDEMLAQIAADVEDSFTTIFIPYATPQIMTRVAKITNQLTSISPVWTFMPEREDDVENEQRTKIAEATTNMIQKRNKWKRQWLDVAVLAELQPVSWIEVYKDEEYATVPRPNFDLQETGRRRYRLSSERKSIWKGPKSQVWPCTDIFPDYFARSVGQQKAMHKRALYRTAQIEELFNNKEKTFKKPEDWDPKHSYKEGFSKDYWWQVVSSSPKTIGKGLTYGTYAVDEDFHEVVESWVRAFDPQTGQVETFVATMLDRKWLVRKPRRSPYRFCIFPFVPFMSMPLPLCNFGLPTMEQLAQINRGINLGYNYALSGSLWGTFGPLIAGMGGQFQSATEYGLGQIWYYNKSATEIQQLIQKAPSVDAIALLLRYADEKGQVESAATDPVQGASVSQSKTTLGEFQGRVAQAISRLDFQAEIFYGEQLIEWAKLIWACALDSFSPRFQLQLQSGEHRETWLSEMVADFTVDIPQLTLTASRERDRQDALAAYSIFKDNVLITNDPNAYKELTRWALSGIAGHRTNEILPDTEVEEDLDVTTPPIGVNNGTPGARIPRAVGDTMRKRMAPYLNVGGMGR